MTTITEVMIRMNLLFGRQLCHALAVEIRPDDIDRVFIDERVTMVIEDMDHDPLTRTTILKGKLIGRKPDDSGLMEPRTHYIKLADKDHVLLWRKE